MRLIDADALHLELSKEASHCLALGTETGVSWATALQDAKRRLRSAPTIEAELIVRCKDCKKNPKFERKNKKTVWCRQWRSEVKETDFCSYGER